MFLPNRKTPRASWWNYSNIADYHITICTKDQVHYFGEIEEGEMKLSPDGKIAAEIWQLIPEKFPNIRLDEFIIMPNHLHGLIGFGGIIGAEFANGINRAGANIRTDTINRVCTEISASGISSSEIPFSNSIPKKSIQNNPMIKYSLSSVMRWFKGRCSFEIKKINPNFKWHGRFHDSIIKSKEQYENTVNYIRNNPKNWEGN